MRLSDLSFKYRFALLALVVLAAFAALIFAGGRTLMRVMVNGDIYHEVIADKDLATALMPAVLDLGPVHRTTLRNAVLPTAMERAEQEAQTEAQIAAWKAGYEM